MLPQDMKDGVPKSVLRYVWNLKVLKSGLSLSDEQQVRDWFHLHPFMLERFQKANRVLEKGIHDLQQECIQMLQEEIRREVVPINPNRFNESINYGNEPLRHDDYIDIKMEK
jgi:hypothetical protein